MLFVRAVLCNRGARLAVPRAAWAAATFLMISSRYHARPAMAATLSHTDARGRARMVEGAAKPEPLREAVASAEVLMLPATLRLVERAVGAHGKGDVLAVARLGGMIGGEGTAAPL